MITYDLKLAILKSAFSGKLTETLMSDSNINKMINDIEIVHKELIQNKIIKKDSKVTPIAENEYPFHIPESWRWSKFYYVLDVRDGTHDSPKFYSDGVPLITSKNLNSNGMLDMDNVKFISEEDAISINNRSRVDPGDILFAMIGSIGNPVMINEKPNFCIKNMALFKNPVKNILNNQYLYYYLLFSQDRMKKESSGGVQQFVSLNYLRNFYIPLPPIEEQQRIVDRVELLLNKIKEIKPIEEELNLLIYKFPNDMKKSLLLSAFRGELSDSHDSDTNVEIVLNKVVEDKEINDKEIKRRKINKEFNELYKLPSNWKWVKLGYLCEVIRGLTFSASFKEQIKDTILVLRGGNIDSKTEKLIYDDNIYVEKNIPNLNQYLQIGDTLIVASSGTKTSVGKSAYISEIADNISFGGFMMVVRPYSEIVNPKYISYQIKMYRNKIINDTNGYISNITNEILNNLMIPLPPIEEQQRIVDKLEQLLPICDDIYKIVSK